MDLIAKTVLQVQIIDGLPRCYASCSNVGRKRRANFQYPLESSNEEKCLCVRLFCLFFSDMFISFSPVETPPPPAEPKWSDSPSAVNHLTQVPVLTTQNFTVILRVKQ